MNRSSDYHKYTEEPATDEDAQVQGIAMARAILNDPQDKITKSIARSPHALDRRCQMVHAMLRLNKTETNVVFIIATWCMLGGNTSSTWTDGEHGHKPGEKDYLMDWGKKMIEELKLLGRTAHYDFKFCKPYVTGKISRKRYNYNRAFKDYYRICNPLPRRVGTAKRAADSSPENSDPAKRQKTTAASGQIQQHTDLHSANETQLNEMDRKPEQATTNQAKNVGSSDSLAAKLSREQLEAMNRDLRSKNERLEKQGAANLSSILKHSEKASALEDLVKKASKDSVGTLDLVQAGIDPRKDNDHWEFLVSARQMELRHLDEGETLEGRVRALNVEVHDKETLLEEITKLRADLEASKQETARVMRWLDGVEVETITRIPGINFVRKSTMNLKGVSEGLDGEARLRSMGSNGVEGHKYGRS